MVDQQLLRIVALLELLRIFRIGRLSDISSNYFSYCVFYLSWSRRKNFKNNRNYHVMCSIIQITSCSWSLRAELRPLRSLLLLMPRLATSMGGARYSAAARMR